MADIVVRGVTKSFDRGRVAAVSDVDLTVADGEFFVLLGPSGCGKTTLLRMIAGLEFADSGSVTIGNRDVTTLPPRRRDLAMVFQNYAVFPHLTVFQNIAFGLRMKHTDAATTDERVRWAADMVELSDLLQRRPGQLSGGQRQRVAVARAIAAGPSVLLMDEPLSNLDGLIVQGDAPLRVYEHPASTFVGGFIGNPPMNFLPAAIEVTDGQPLARVGAHAFPVPEELRGLAGRRLLAGIRGESVVPSAAGAPGAVPGRVRVVEPLGSHVLVTVTIEGTEFKVLTQSDFAVAEDAELWLRPAPAKVRWFDPGT